MAKVRKFEDGLKLSIQCKIVGLLLQDMDSMVRTTMAIESEVGDAWSIRDTGACDKRKDSQLSSSSERLLLHEGFKDKAATMKAKARINYPKIEDTSGLLASQGKEYVSRTTILGT